MSSRFSLRSTIALIVFFVALRVDAAPPPPSDPHPRMFMNGSNLATAMSQAKQAGTSAKAVVDHCQDTIDRPQNYVTRPAPDDEMWTLAAVSCAFAYLATGKAEYATQAILYWKYSLNSLLDSKT